MSSKINALIEAAIIAALAMALSLVPDFASWFTPSFGAAPLILFSLRRGSKYGIFAGFIWGLLYFILGRVYYLSLSQVLLEYILAFASMGLAGLFAAPLQKALKQQQRKKALFSALIAACFAVFTRYFWHFLAGVIFWGAYAPKGMSPLFYSLLVNGSACIFTLLFVTAALIILLMTQSSFFLPKR
ncbi:energy-coupled thiamine transporter ThiT [Streptococcus chenjunshii]|uniref:Energy-coupled thiamine transporter ThiT n=1 Tax=Streptococcus chenjunshii TaxID=2173853 RepID=A0A372KLH6_9STRE|nr:energy-coupled thiamine transporter ThiT [Streptococcus chenjunshii]AXQ79053.1 energy-coupled thiamine transporter ThiT [Streptococcus chenjunshii]RFU51249.1 energy-coupled thiamine transporter ThiT [Streptococcus chenjunshii]RFU53135.1 energy-coupled thiamine transporter ThiT [Streptococcus chenjunshii]